LKGCIRINIYKRSRFFHLEKSPSGKVVVLNRIPKNQ
jgi:hypothetical protein